MVGLTWARSASDGTFWSASFVEEVAAMFAGGDLLYRNSSSEGERRDGDLETRRGYLFRG